MTEHIPLVFSICKRLGVKSPIEDSDEFADGCLALAKYYPRLDGRNPSTYLHPCIRGCILRGRKKRMSQSGIADDSPTAMTAWRPFCALPPSLPAKEPRAEDGSSILDELSPRDREIMYLRIVCGRSFGEIGRLVGLPPRDTQLRHDEILREFRRRREPPLTGTRRDQALQMRARGHTYREIGERLGVSKNRAMQLARAYDRTS